MLKTNDFFTLIGNPKKYVAIIILHFETKKFSFKIVT